MPPPRLAVRCVCRARSRWSCWALSCSSVAPAACSSSRFCRRRWAGRSSKGSRSCRSLRRAHRRHTSRRRSPCWRFPSRHTAASACSAYAARRSSTARRASAGYPCRTRSAPCDQSSAEKRTSKTHLYSRRSRYCAHHSTWSAESVSSPDPARGILEAQRATTRAAPEDARLAAARRSRLSLPRAFAAALTAPDASPDARRRTSDLSGRLFCCLRAALSAGCASHGKM